MIIMHKVFCTKMRRTVLFNITETTWEITLLLKYTMYNFFCSALGNTDGVMFILSCSDTLLFEIIFWATMRKTELRIGRKRKYGLLNNVSSKKIGLDLI